ncbi:MAG TPA: LamG domain-containing protein, partial [Candidatus Kapabacteria bacterium]|nr:LamG domain-containing protein [Candidatus Kapabacteria bacterium]
MHYLRSGLLVLLILLFQQTSAFAQAACDKNKECVGNALTIDVTRGKLAQYVDVDTSYRLRNIRNAITFEAWLKPVQQGGKKVFVAGLWGPNRDNNDQWVVYLQDNLVSFELSADNSFQGANDNTLARATVPDLYTRGWLHLAATWDGATSFATIYIDGVEVARSNSPFPLTVLKQVESKTLPLQIGSTNSLFDDTLNHRSFRGQIDEVRLWDRALTQQEIICQKHLSLGGREAGLVLYYRMNEDETAQTLCDATGHDIAGRMRSGAAPAPSDRVVPPTYSADRTSINDILVCVSTKTYRVTLTDTSICGSRVNIGFQGQDAGLFSSTPNSLTLTPGTPLSFDVTVNAILIGNITANLVISNANRCGDPVVIPITINRRTELSYSINQIKFDTLIAGCIEKTYEERTLQICNTTTKPINIFGTSLDSNRFTLRPADPSKPLPRTLAPGECWDLVVRFDAEDTTKTWYDTIRISSDEACAGAGIIPVMGHTQEVLGILFPDGKRRMTQMDFEPVCPDQTSNSQTYQFRNLLKTLQDTVYIDNIEFSTGFLGARMRFPLSLIAQRAYQPTFVRSRPIAPGPYTGQMKITGRYKGCTIVKIVELSGRGISVDVRFDQNAINFGSVTIGKSTTRSVSLTNHGQDERRMSAYLKVGDAFSFPAGRSFRIGPGAQQTIQVEFRPREPIMYYDTLCVFDEDCYETICIPIEGRGYFEALEYTPAYINIENIIGCQCAESVVTVKNISGGTRTIISDNLVDATGKFTLLQRATPGAFAAGGSYEYKVRYCPNDMQDDRADQAFIDINLDNGEKYQILIRATSVAPRVYVTPLTTFNVVEVGWTKDDSVLIENISRVPVNISAITAPAGYTITSIVPNIPFTLQPRDSMWVLLRFAPTTEADYNGQLRVTIDAPCAIANTGQLTGTGKVAKLQVPLTFVNYSMVKPCDCSDREIPLNNTSNLQDLTIDSIWIDGANVTPLVPSIYTWRSKRTGGQTLPYKIPPQSADTLIVSFCPNIPATNANRVTNDTLHIVAHSPGWSQEFKTVLSGRREINFIPDRTLLSFPATRVDTTLGPILVNVFVPDVLSNPSGDSIVITNVTFVPDQRVFTARAANGQPLPWVVHRLDTFKILVDFRPRAPRDYEARMHIHTTFPCVGVDTTILVRGSGFAPAFGLQMAFDTNAVGRDTLMLTTCDTLVLPIMITRDIPQPVIDMLFRLEYDSTALQLLDIITPYTNTASIVDTGDGARALLKNARDVKAGTFAWVRFAVKGGPIGFPILLTDIDFDSDSLVNFKIVAGVDRAWVIIDQPMIEIQPLAAFDTVNVKQCKDVLVMVTNPGVIPVVFDSLTGLHPWFSQVAFSRPVPDSLFPGDTTYVTLRFCPRDEYVFDTIMFASSTLPCVIEDTARLTAVGYAPPFPMALVFDSMGVAVDSVIGTINDTILVPISIDRDMPLSPIDLRFELAYNPRALQYMEATSSYGPVDVAYVNGSISLTIEDCDSVRFGEIATIKYVVAAPDSIKSPIVLTPLKFTSDSLMWLKPIPVGDTATVKALPYCNIDRLNFIGGNNELTPPRPNPAQHTTTIEFEFFEDVPAVMDLYDLTGGKKLE